MAVGVDRCQEIRRGTHEQIDFIIVAHRWKNSVPNAESDTNANIHSDHYPVITDIRTKLKAVHTGMQGRVKYKECSPDQCQELNQDVRNNLLSKTNYRQHAEVAMRMIERHMPKIPLRTKEYIFSEATINILEERQKSIDSNDSLKNRKRDKIIQCFKTKGQNELHHENIVKTS